MRLANPGGRWTTSEPSATATRRVCSWCRACASSGCCRARRGARPGPRGVASLPALSGRRAGFAAAGLTPAVARAPLKVPPEELLGPAVGALQRDGLPPLLDELLRSLVAAARRTAEIL